MSNVLSEREAYRAVAPVIKDPENLAAVLDIHPENMRPWYEKHLKDTPNPIGTVVDRARDYFFARHHGKERPANVAELVYHRLADWYATTVRPHAPSN